MHWHRLLRDAVGSPSMEGFENHGDVALGDVADRLKWARQMAGGRLFSYFTRSLGDGRGEKERSSLPRNATSHWCKQNGVGTCLMMEGWARLAAASYMGMQTGLK